jgi:hypothetical protein
MADPGVKKMVDGWADSTEYELTVKVKTGVGPKRNVADVTSAEVEGTDEETPETETETEPATAEAEPEEAMKPASKPAATYK